MKKITLRTPRGTFTRQTARHYTHVVVYDTIGKNDGVTWHGSHALAEKAAQAAISWRERYLQKHPDDDELRASPCAPAIYEIEEYELHPDGSVGNEGPKALQDLLRF